MKNYDEIIKSANDTMMQLHQMVLESHEEIERLNNIIKEAIEYITPYRDETINWYEFTINDKVKLLEILKGSDE